MSHHIELYGNSAARVPLINTNTSGRAVMGDNQAGQQPGIKNPEDAIFITGYENQLTKFGYDIVIENDSVHVATIKKFGNRNDMWGNDDWTSVILMMYDTVEEELTHYEVPRYRILGNKFGMSYIIDEDYVNSLSVRDLIPAGKRIAWSKSNSGNTHKTGRNLNVLTCSIPEVGEDLIQISDRVLDDFTIKQYETFETGYGKNSIMADVHGKDDEYKAFPDLNDIVKASRVLFSKIPLDIKSLKKEDYNIIDNALLYTDKGLKVRRPHFTDHTIMRYDGRLVDIDVHYNAKSGENIESDDLGTQVGKYLMMSATYHSEIVKAYEYYRKNYQNEKISFDTSNLISTAMVYIEEPIRGRAPNISRKKKRSKLDMYTVKLTMEYNIKPNTGFKFTNRYAGKGVIKIVPHADMPRDANGKIADMAIFSKGVVARTILGLPYEQYFMASSRQTKDSIKDLLAVKSSKEIDNLSTSEIDNTFDYLLDYLSNYNTLQYKLYSGTFVGGSHKVNEIPELVNRQLNRNQKVEILKEIYSKELYIVYNIAEAESAYNIVNRLEESKFKLKIVPVYIKGIDGEFKELKSRSFIAPLYTMMLNKITDSYLGASTFFLNGYGLPTGKSKEDGRYPYKFKGVRGWGESEYRVVAAYGSPRLMQILNDRSKSIENHRKYYYNQMEARGVNSSCLIPDRIENSDIAINLVRGVLEPAGITIGTRR